MQEVGGPGEVQREEREETHTIRIDINVDQLPAMIMHNNADASSLPPCGGQVMCYFAGQDRTKMARLYDGGTAVHAEAWRQGSPTYPALL